MECRTASPPGPISVKRPPSGLSNTPVVLAFALNIRRLKISLNSTISFGIVSYVMLLVINYVSIFSWAQDGLYSLFHIDKFVCLIRIMQKHMKYLRSVNFIAVSIYLASIAMLKYKYRIAIFLFFFGILSFLPWAFYFVIWLVLLEN